MCVTPNTVYTHVLNTLMYVYTQVTYTYTYCVYIDTLNHTVCVYTLLNTVYVSVWGVYCVSISHFDTLNRYVFRCLCVPNTLYMFVKHTDAHWHTVCVCVFDTHIHVINSVYTRVLCMWHISGIPHNIS